MSENHAFVFGASGLVGWAIVDELLKGYPVRGTFATITALVNRPLDVHASQWSTNSTSDAHFKLVSGVNLTDGSVKDFSSQLRDKVPEITTATHVYYCAFKQEDDPELESQINVQMMERVLGALEQHAARLQFFFYPAGTRIYGINTPGGLYPAPFRESMTRDPSPAFRAKVHYYAFEDLLVKASEQARRSERKWTWCAAIPDAIVGFAPTGSTFSLPAHWAKYLFLRRQVNGLKASVPFPGTNEAYRARFNSVSSALLAHFAIHASLHPHAFGNGQIFNIADSAEPSSMEEQWPRLCAYFDLAGVEPQSGEDGKVPVSQFIERHKDILEKHGLRSNTVFKGTWLDNYGYGLISNRNMDLDKTRNAGFSEERDPVDSWFQTFAQFEEAGMLPHRSEQK